MDSLRGLTPEQEALVTENLWVAERAARRLWWSKNIRHAIELDDFIAVAYEEMCKEAPNWNGVGSFGGWVYNILNFRLMDYLRKNGPLHRSGTRRDVETAEWREETSGADKPPTENSLREEQFVDVTAEFIANDFVTYCLSSDVLDARERYVIHERFVQGRTLASIAIDLDVTEGRISQIESKATQKLRRDPNVINAIR